MGDVHPHGNPHFYLSPKALAESAAVIATTLSAVDSVHAAQYQKGLAAFVTSMNSLAEEVSARLKPLRDAQNAAGKALIMEYHQEFNYFFEQYGLKSFASVEEKPGVPPAAGRLGSLATSAKASGVRVVLATDYNPAGTLRRFRELSGVKQVVVPTMIQPNGTYKSYSDLQRHIADSLVGLAVGGKLQK
jgi:zinc/manganese transport system substrate-binding protein